MRKKIAVCLILFLAVALCIGIPKLIPDEPYDLSDVPRFYAANGYFVYNNYSTGRSYGPVRAPSDAIDYAVNYRLLHYNAEFNAEYELLNRRYGAYYDPDYDLWMVYDRPRNDPLDRSTRCFPGADMGITQFLTFIRGSDGMILSFLIEDRPEDSAFLPPET